MIVFDASLAVKWYLPEAGALEARAAFQSHAGQIVAPDIILTEVISAMVRRGNINKAERSASEACITKFLGLVDEGFVSALPMRPRQMEQASRHALDLGHPLKDCLYLVLAMELGCKLITCDTKFAAKAKHVWSGVTLLGADDAE